MTDDDILDRLRAWTDSDEGNAIELVHDAITAIEQLREENRQMKEHLLKRHSCEFGDSCPDPFDAALAAQREEP